MYLLERLLLNLSSKELKLSSAELSLWIMYFSLCVCKVGVVNCPLLGFGVEVATYFICEEVILTCAFPYILFCSSLVLAKHFAVPLLKRLLDLKCIIAHFCKRQKHKVLPWQKEHFEVLGLLKIVVCPTSKSLLAMKSGGQTPVCVAIAAAGC